MSTQRLVREYSYQLYFFFLRRRLFFYYFFKIYLFIYLFLAALGLRCCAWAFFSCRERELFFTAVCGLLIAVASLVAAHRLQSAGSVVAAHGLSCSMACGIFPDQGLNPCSLNWQADSQPLHHQGSPIPATFVIISGNNLNVHPQMND